MTKRLHLIALMALLMLACGWSGSPGQPIRLPGFSIGGPGTQEAPRVIIPQDSSATATPFLPIDPTALALTPTPIPTPAWGGFPGPSVPPNVPIPPPATPIEQPDGQTNVLLLGSDQRPYGGGFRTDTIILLTLNSDLGKVSMTSFPRDLYVYIPGWTMQRINTAQAYGGFEQMQSTFAYNFGFMPDYFVMINFWGFTAVIDNLGGIHVNVGSRLTDHRDGYGQYTVPAGSVHMDGETALWYVRSRYTSSDFDRARRQQEVMIAIFYRLVSLNGIQRASDLYNLYKNNVVTNAAFSELAPYLGLAADLAGNSSALSTYQIGRTHVTPFTTSAGAAVLLPNYEAISVTLRQALHVP